MNLFIHYEASLHAEMQPINHHSTVCLYTYRVIPGHRNHVFDPASVFLSNRDLFSKQKRPKEQATGQIPDYGFYLPVSMSQNDPVHYEASCHAEMQSMNPNGI